MSGSVDSHNGDCPHCGFAMNRELDRVCPRCKKSPEQRPAAAPPAPPAPRPAMVPPAPPGTRVAEPPSPPDFVPPTPPPAGRATPGAPASTVAPPVRAVRPRSRQQPSAAKWLIGIGAATALVVVVVAGVLAVTHKMNSPEYKATVALRKATEALEAKQWDATVESCKQALEYDGRLSEASFGAGLATLHVADKDSAEESFGKLMEQAKWGDTKPFNVADAWMKDCIERCDKDLERVTVDRSLVNNKRTKACAQTYLFLTAFLRAAAAADAKQDTDTEAWLFVAEKHLKAAETTDPSCPYHKDARKEFDEVLAERKAAHSPWAAMRR